VFELFIARRYLSARRKQVVISVITVISVIGVAAGVMALVIALAINNGFRNTLERSLVGATAHVMILEKERGPGIEGWEEIAERLAKLPNVVSAEPGLYDGGYVSGPINGSEAVIKGITAGKGAPTREFLAKLKAGSFEDLQAGGEELPGIILGVRMAERLGAQVGKPVELLVPNGQLTPLGPRPSVVRLRVAGIFETGSSDIDSGWAYMALDAMQRAYGLDDVVNSIELQLNDIYQAPFVASFAEAVIGPKLAATTWQEQSRQVMNALRMERVVSMVTIGLILIVAALNILITLVMMVMEKHRDIAILMSMGARAAQIRRIFVLEGALIGAVGTVIGLAVGYTLCYLAGEHRWIRLDEEVYPFSFVPFEARWLDGVWIAAVAMAVSLVATLYPARSATRIAPAEAIRYE
jgi:lipoprotein-releasing system permease protein